MKIRPLLFVAALAALPVITHAESASENWSNLCAKCHGADGKGHTKIGSKLHVKDYTKDEFQAEFSDAALLKSILLGIEDEGHARMPSFKDKLSAAEAKELVAHIRKFKS